MDYKTWSDKIASRFFREENAEKRVYLHVSRDLIQDVGMNQGLDAEDCLDDFVSSVKDGHRWSDRGVAEAPLHMLKLEPNWAKLWKNGCPYPPYIGFLGLFVLAAGYNPEDKFDPSSYYPRLNSLLGKGPVSSIPRGFEEMHEVWEHLERWANRTKRGSLGRFEVQHLDARANVGIPRSQRVLTDHERKVAKWVFSRVGLDPALSPSEEQVASLIRSHGREKIRKLTYDSLAPSTNRPKYRRALLEAILEVLHDWDGSPIEIEEEEDQKRTGYRGTLALSFRESFGEVQFKIRCLTRRDFPEGELVLQDESGSEYICHEVVGGWSTVLQDRQGNDLDPTILDLSSNYDLEDPDQDWRFTLRPAGVRVFLEPGEEGMPDIGGHLEVRQLPLRTPFYLLTSEEDADVDLIESWGENSCEGFEQIHRRGMPSSWCLYKSDGALDDQGVHGKYDVLSQPKEAQITLDGGIRVHPRRNEYFTFAPPSIRVRGNVDVEVFLNEERLSEREGELYRLSEKYQADAEYTVAAKVGGKVIKKKHFFLRSQTEWKSVSSPKLDKFGSLRKDTDGRGEEKSTSQQLHSYDTPLNALPQVFEQEGKVVLLGRVPGQVAEWPDEDLPDEWQAVWAVPKYGRAHSCWPNSSLPDPEPVPDLNQPGGLRYPRSDIEKWKEVLYHWRKRTHPPESHTDLWNKYRQHAREKC